MCHPGFFNRLRSRPCFRVSRDKIPPALAVMMPLFLSMLAALSHLGNSHSARNIFLIAGAVSAYTISPLVYCSYMRMPGYHASHAEIDREILGDIGLEEVAPQRSVTPAL